MMTDKDAILAQFFQAHEPPVPDARFVAATLTRTRKTHAVNTAALWLGGGGVVAAVLDLVGPQLGDLFIAMGPAMAPVFVAGTVLFMTRRMLWARA